MDPGNEAIAVPAVHVGISKMLLHNCTYLTLGVVPDITSYNGLAF